MPVTEDLWSCYHVGLFGRLYRWRGVQKIVWFFEEPWSGDKRWEPLADDDGGEGGTVSLRACNLTQ